MSRYGKTIAAAVISVLILVVSDLGVRLADGRLDTNDWFALALLVLNAAAVYAVPNRPPAGQSADPGISEQGV